MKVGETETVKVGRALVRLTIFAAASAMLSTNFSSELGAAEGGAPQISFSRQVLPVLAENCFACHGFDEASRQADLRLDTREGATAKRDGVAAIIEGKPEQSELIARIRSQDPDVVMPPHDSGKKLTEAQRQILNEWIRQGAGFERHWSFEPPRKPELPEAAGSEHPIDRFLDRKLAQAGVDAAPRAAFETLIRRVSLDLTGLPPTLAEIDSFVQASERDEEAAWSELVDRLLASPHYGERWGRWWLDQARYADSNGYSIDSPRSIWKYRDWVVSAMNRDLPFDQFTVEQLAGDLLPNATVAQQVATGFHRNTQINQEGGIDREQYRVDSVFDRVATTGTVWLGLTVGCAQCHDHKFDPIEQREFYKLFAFLNDQDEPSIKVYDPSVDVSAINARKKAIEAELNQVFKNESKTLDAWESKLTEDSTKKLSGNAQKALKVERQKRNFAQRRDVAAASPVGKKDEFRKLHEELAELDRVLSSAPTTMVLRERSEPRKTSILIKGDFTRPSDEVSPGTPAILHPLKSDSKRPNRLDLARWIVSRENPLTARVMINRVWQQYFGLGIVSTENDFGQLGAAPSHPELLDWLASRFMESDWSLKVMHRLIVTSDAYRRSSVISEKARTQDPDNLLLGRQSRLRLDAEIVRDVALSVCGLLAADLGGPPVYPPIADGVMGQGQVQRSWKASTGKDRYRRGLYTFIYRSTPPPSLNVFDAPDGFSSCTRRNRSNTPLQSLTLMNDSAFFEFAQALKAIIDRDGVSVAFRRCTGRQPEADELQILEQLDSMTAARTLLSLDETITRE